MKYKLIIFDCDGTLVDSESISNRVIGQMMTQMGLPMNTQESIDLFAGGSMQRILDFIDKNNLKVPDGGFENEYRQLTNNLFVKELKVFEGVYQLLDSIKVPICIASNGPREKMKVTLPATDLNKYFSEDHIFSAYDLNSWKPDPALFLHACNKMNVLPENTLIIEDTISGVDGALNAGIDVLAFCPHEIDVKIKERNVPILNSMKSIEKLIFAA